MTGSRHTLHTLIIQPSNQMVFVVEERLLPAITVEARDVWDLDAGNAVVQQAFTDLLGVAPVVLRRFEPEARTGDTRPSSTVYELEFLEPAIAGSWVPAIELAHPPHRVVAGQAISALDTPPTRAQWMSRGWRALADGWIVDQMAQHGHTVTDIEPHRSWCISYLARIATEAGERFFFKASIDLPLFANEGAITAYLHERMPDLVPQVISVDRERRWFILADFGKPADDFQPLDLADRLAVIERSADMQQRCSDDVDELLANGCVDRRMPRLIEAIESWGHDDSGIYQGLSTEEAQSLRGHREALLERCRALLDSRLPATLVHGDLHDGNVHVDGDRVTIFDWSDASVGIPWIDMFPVVDAQDSERDQVLESYLGHWSDLAPADELRRLWRLWQPLFFFHHAASYVSLFEHIDPTTAWELGGNASRFVRSGLELLVEDDPA